MKQMGDNSGRLEWLSVLQGFGMLCVVVGHAWLTQTDDKNHIFVTGLIQWIYRFHMPLFFFIAGFLFFKTRVRIVGIGWFEVVKDKARRLLIPYVVFTVFVVMLKVVFPGVVNRGVRFDLDWLVRVVFFPFDNPFQGLWFIATLFYMFLPVVFYRWLVRRNNGMFFLYLLSLMIAAIVPAGIEFACISRVALHFQFFVLGMLLYGSIDKFFSLRAVLVFLIAAIAIDFYGLGYSVVATFWILAFFSFFGLVSKFVPDLFSSFSGYTFQIYLMSVFVQIPVRVLYAKANSDYFVFFLVSILAGIYVPVFLSKFISAFFPRVARLPFGL